MKGLEKKKGLSGKEIQDILSKKNVSFKRVDHDMRHRPGPYFLDTPLTTPRKLGHIEEVLRKDSDIWSPSSASMTYYAWYSPTEDFAFDVLKDGVITIEDRMLVERTRIYQW